MKVYIENMIKGIQKLHCLLNVALLRNFSCHLFFFLFGVKLQQVLLVLTIFPRYIFGENNYLLCNKPVSNAPGTLQNLPKVSADSVGCPPSRARLLPGLQQQRKTRATAACQTSSEEGLKSSSIEKTVSC